MLTAQTSFLQRYRKPLLLLTAAWTAIGVVIYVWVPLLVPALLLLSPVAPVAWYAATRLRPPPHKPSAITLALILAGAYLTLNASWSLSPAMAHVTLAFFFLFVLTSYFTCNTLPDNDADVLRAMAIGLCAGLAIGSVVLLFEIASLQWTHRTLMSLVPALRPKPRDMILENGWIVFLQSYLINRNITAMTFLFWPAAAGDLPRGAGRATALVARRRLCRSLRRCSPPSTPPPRSPSSARPWPSPPFKCGPPRPGA